MTREDEIKKIALCYAHDELKDNHGDVEDIVASAFIDGANFADAHPHWISVEDKLPPLRQGVLAYNGVTMYIAWVSDDFVWRTHKEHCFRTYPVTHWMPLPVIPNLENIGKHLKGGENENN